ncbi:hypothetical protein [Rhizobium sp. RAF56]|uniref:hypothetical protein n=1 Tax=Rhizobium sp. RAF56 TaxID=3233062 RepID=UPI003F960082
MITTLLYLGVSYMLPREILTKSNLYRGLENRRGRLFARLILAPFFLACMVLAVPILVAVYIAGLIRMLRHG